MAKNLKNIFHRTGNRALKTIINETINIDESEKFSNRLKKLNQARPRSKKFTRLLANLKLHSDRNYIHTEKAEYFQNY